MLAAPEARETRRARRTQPGFVAEIVGVAGSGKSTLLRALRAELGLSGPGYRLPRWRSFPHVARTAARSLVPLLAERHPGWFWFELKLLATYDAMVADFAARRPTAPVLLDQGPVYSYVAATRTVLLGDQRSQLRPRLVRTLDRFAACVDAVLWLDASDDVLVERIRNRDQEHMIKARSKDEILAFLAEYRAAYGALLERFAEHHGVPVMRFDTGSETPARLATRMRNELEKHGFAS
jgi:thymidylate kinase